MLAASGPASRHESCRPLRSWGGVLDMNNSCEIITQIPLVLMFLFLLWSKIPLSNIYITSFVT